MGTLTEHLNDSVKKIQTVVFSFFACQRGQVCSTTYKLCLSTQAQKNQYSLTNRIKPAGQRSCRTVVQSLLSSLPHKLAIKTQGKMTLKKTKKKQGYWINNRSESLRKPIFSVQY